MRPPSDVSIKKRRIPCQFTGGSIFFPAIGEYIKERMGGEALVPARPQRMAVGGEVFSEDGRGRAWTGSILSNLIITTGKKMLSSAGRD